MNQEIEMIKVVIKNMENHVNELSTEVAVLTRDLERNLRDIEYHFEKIHTNLDFYTAAMFKALQGRSEDFSEKEEGE